MTSNHFTVAMVYIAIHHIMCRITRYLSEFLILMDRVYTPNQSCLEAISNIVHADLRSRMPIMPIHWLAWMGSRSCQPAAYCLVNESHGKTCRSPRFSKSFKAARPDAGSYPIVQQATAIKLRSISREPPCKTSRSKTESICSPLGYHAIFRLRRRWIPLMDWGDFPRTRLWLGRRCFEGLGRRGATKTHIAILRIRSFENLAVTH